MKLLLYGDVHWSQNSSIIRSRGNIYSTRLEKLIDSMNWLESKAAEVDAIICLGDFFDHNSLNSEELTALKEVHWSDKPHIFIVGNHEIDRLNDTVSSAHIFSLLPNSTIIDKVTKIEDTYSNIYFIPYTQIFDFPEIDKSKQTIILSHNDIKGVQMGGFISKIGFDINDIISNCDIFINGHLHNGCRVDKNVYNIGNFTGQNFSEDATKYNHEAWVLDTNTLNIKKYENPYAFNFYKLSDIDNIELKNNSVVSITCKPENLEKSKEFCKSNKNIIESKVSVELISKKEEIQLTESIMSDKLSNNNHIQLFKDFIHSVFENNDIIEEELEKVCK